MIVSQGVEWTSNARVEEGFDDGMIEDGRGGQEAGRNVRALTLAQK
jgi:hypothetical protein